MTIRSQIHAVRYDVSGMTDGEREILAPVERRTHLQLRRNGTHGGSTDHGVRAFVN